MDKFHKNMWALKQPFYKNMGIRTAISQKCVDLKTTVFQIYGPYYNYSTNITTVSQIYGPCYNYSTNITTVSQILKYMDLVTTIQI